MKRSRLILADADAETKSRSCILSPSMLQAFLSKQALAESLHSLRNVMCGGEALIREATREVQRRDCRAR